MVCKLGISLKWKENNYSRWISDGFNTADYYPRGEEKNNVIKFRLKEREKG